MDPNIIGAIFFWVLLSALVGVYGHRKGLSGGGCFFIALVFSPLIGLLAVAVSKEKKEVIAKRQGLKKCPQCAEYVQKEAAVCRYCKTTFSAVTA